MICFLHQSSIDDLSLDNAMIKNSLSELKKRMMVSVLAQQMFSLLLLIVSFLSNDVTLLFEIEDVGMFFHNRKRRTIDI